MNVEIEELRSARPLDLIDAGDAWDEASGNFTWYARKCADKVFRRVQESGWTGTAALWATAELDRLEGALRASSHELDAVGRVLRAAGEMFSFHQTRLRNLLAEAKEQNLTVYSDGSVRHSELAEDDRNDPDRRAWQQAQAQRARDLAERIREVMADATHADEEAARVIRRFTEQARRGAEGRFGIGTELASANALTSTVLAELGMPGRNAPPTEVASWWAALSPTLRTELLTDHPAALGNRDGIPSAARDQANRVNLTRLITEYEARGRLSEAEQRILRGFQSIQKRLTDDADKVPSPFLLGIGDKGQGRAVLAYGNPDAADNISAYVPGLNTGLDDIGNGDGGRAWNIAYAARGLDDTHRTSSIVWLGYDTPQFEWTLDTGNLAVMSDDRAVRGGAELGQFLSGLHATHEGDSPHVTAVGHSYGSLTVGQAAQHGGGIPVDDIVLVGSPGTGAQRADQLGVGADHVWVGSAQYDLVTRAPSLFEELGGPLGPVPHVLDPNESWFGQDPASEEFGARRFGVADGDVANSHSNYFDRENGGRSLQNIAKIVTGQHGSVTGEFHR
ncbi:alpha/beta hydrolase [Streptomyces pathocidini]|uniref:alpha/beta hydrolase n=1 Tax=Streptomyces pathocidini TaxID=1650571 RepID=UPI0033C262AE